MTITISNADDTIDSRDVIERLEELTAERDAAQDPNVWLHENGDELAALQSLAEHAEPYAPDWQDGSQLIRDNYFKQAIDEMVADCYELPKDLPFWMTITYDYDALRQDYTEIDFNGVTYLVR